MNREVLMADVFVYACKECEMDAPAWEGIENAISICRLCHVCRKECEPRDLRFKQYTRGDIFYMDKIIALQQKDIDELIQMVKILEAHIKYQPGGEGALEALIHFNECKKE